MAEIKIPQSVKRVQRQAVAPRVAPGAIISAGKGMEDVGETLLNIEESVRNINNLKQTTQATTAANEELNKINAEATQDPQLFENQQNYYSRIDEVGSTASQGIADQETRLKFEKSFSTRRSNLRFSIGKEARRNLASTTKVALDDFSDNQKLAYNQAASFPEREMVLKSTIGMFDSALANGLLTEKQYKERVDSISDDFEMTRMDAMIESNPVAALSTMINKEDHFSNSKLKKEYREKSEKAVEKMTDEGATLLLMEEDQTEIEDIRLLAKGELTNHLMDTQESAGTLLPEVREIMEENMLSPVAKFAATDDALFAKLLLRASDDELESKDARELMKDVIRSNTLGNLSRVDMERLIGKFSAQYQSAANKHERSWVRKSVKAVSGFFKRIGLGDDEPKLTAEIMRQLIDDVNTENIPFSEIDKRKNQLIKEAVKQKRPSTSNLPDVPNAVANSKAGIRETFEAPTDLKGATALTDDKQFTQEDLEFTAQRHGLTVEEVLNKVGASKDAAGSSGKPKE